MALLILFLTPVALFALVRLEERKRPDVAVMIVLGLVLVEALIYPTQNGVPGGLFHPSLAGRALRLPEVIIPVALVARVVVRGLPDRLGATAMAWLAFSVWLGLGLPIGVIMGNAFDQAFFQAKAVIYLGGGFALVAGVPIERLAHSPVTRRLLLGLGAIVGASAPFALANRTLSIDLPLIPGATLGRISPDASTIFAVIAMVALLLEGARRRRSLVAGAAAVPLLLSPLVATQRAAVLGLVASALVLLVALFGPTWRRRIRSTPTEAVLLLCIVLFPVLTIVAARAALSTSPDNEIVPLAGVVNDTFLTTRKAQSAQTRENLWSEGLARAREYPLTGLGLGSTYSVETAAEGDDLLVGGGFHNVVIDLLVRRGLVGVALFVVAVGLTLRDALAIWRHHLDRRVAVFCGACGAAIAGLLAKSMVESLFEKFRLATLLGLLIGAVASGASSLRESREPVTRDDLLATS